MLSAVQVPPLPGQQEEEERLLVVSLSVPHSPGNIYSSIWVSGAGGTSLQFINILHWCLGNFHSFHSFQISPKPAFCGLIAGP